MEPTKQLTSPDAEMALVGAALIDTKVFAIDVAPDDFHDQELAEIWAAGQHVVASGEYADIVSVSERLERAGVNVPFSRLSHLVNLEGVDCTHAPTYAKIVKDFADRRRVEQDLQSAARVLYRSNGTWRNEVAGIGARLVQHAREPQPAREPIKTTWTAAELLAAEFPEPQWAVPGLVPVGLSILAGRPKVGKSWLALQIAHAVGTGGMVLDRHVTAGKVLYLALEDGPRRLQERLRKQNAPSCANITFETSWRRFTDGGLDDLRNAVSGYNLLIVDTLSRVLGGADQNDVADMTVLVGDLQELAIDRDMAVLAIDHHRKPSGSINRDPVDDILGSTGKSAAADAALGLFKEQGKRGAVLTANGREIEWQELALSWDAVTCCWQCEGTAEEVSLRGNKTRVLDALRENRPNSMTLTELASATGIGKNNLLPILNDLVTAGKVLRDAKQGREVPYSTVEGALEASEQSEQ